MQQAMFTPRVGSAPGTTTFQDLCDVGCVGCGTSLMGLGVCRPGHYGQAIMLPGSAPVPHPLQTEPVPLAGASYRHFIPYGSEAAMRGLRGSGMRWDLFALTLGIGFAGVLGFSLWKRKRKR